MNNILTFEDYKKMNIRQVESVIYRQFIEEDNKEEISEGFIRNAINKTMATNFIKSALSKEIEKGQELEANIKAALDSLNAGFEEIEERITADTERGVDPNSKLATIEKVKEAIKTAQSQAFDTLTMIGSEGEIDFSGFMGSATIAAIANFGILFAPVRSIFMTRKAYKYFIGIIKQTIRRNLLLIQLNFDQFENLILQKSFQTEEDSDTMTMRDTLNSIIGAMQSELCGKDSKLKFTGKKGAEMKQYLANFKETQNALIRQHNENTKNNPLSSLWQDQHNNTYTRTLEQIKQYINEDSQKELDALKNSITKMAGKEEELIQYGELLISAAEEYAVQTNHGINNNFIKMSSVFNLENQKKLIELIKAAQDENQAEIERREKKRDLKRMRKERKDSEKSGKTLYEEKLKDISDNYSFDEFNDAFDDIDQKNLRAYFQSDEGKDAYNELTKKNPLYKYFIFSDIELGNTFFNSINDLKIVKVSDMNDFYDSITKQDQTLYYMMAERSLKNAFESKESEDYFGFNINSDDVNRKNILKDETLTGGVKEDGKTAPSKVSKILDDIIKKVKVSNGKRTTFENKTKYFLTTKGSGNNLFNILHNDFKTKIFKDSGEYEKNISTENKEVIAKLIHKQLKIGNNISTQLAEYLIRLEAHMMLKNQKSWFVVKNDKSLLKCFDRNAKDEAVNRTAFVEIREEDVENIKDFLSKYHNLSDNDFMLESEDVKKEENK